METVRLSDYSSYDKNKGGIQKLRHKFRNQILEYWGEDTGILIGKPWYMKDICGTRKLK